MRILFICESHHSANYNIALKVADELHKNNEIYLGYYLDYGENEIEKTGKYEDEFIVQDGTFEREYPLVKNKGIERIKYLLTHPLIFMMLLINHTSFKTHPDYYSSAKKLDRYCIEKNIDAVIGVAYPYEILCIVSGIHSVKNINGIQLDPYSYNIETLKNGEKLHKTRLTQEKKVFRRLNKLFTTGLIKKGLIKSEEFRRESEKIIEIEFPLIDSVDHEKSVSQEKIINKNNGEISFLHAGNFYDDIRPPHKLVELFEVLPDNYILYVAGSNSSDIRKYDKGIRDRVVDLGYLTLEEAEQARKEADFLICYNNLIENQVPSKLFECINEGKPFLNLCQISNCPTLSYVDGYDMAYSVFTCRDMREEASGFSEFVNKMSGNRADRQSIADRFRKCTIEFFASTVLDGIRK